MSYGEEEIGFVCHGPWGVCLSLSLYPHSFGLLLLLSHLCLNSSFLQSFVLMLWSMHMAPLFKCTQCLLSPLCLNFTSFFWCFGICCIWSTLQMHPMLYRSLVGSTRRSFWNFFLSFVRESVEEIRKFWSFVSDSPFLVSFKTSNPFQFRWKDCQFGVWSVCVCVDVWWELGNRLQILNGLDTISVQCNLIFQIPPFHSHTHTHTHTFSLYRLSTPQVVLKYNIFKITINLEVTND
jgi:hypothetical protein